MSCNGTESWLVLHLPTNGLFTISDTNVLAVIGCESNRSFLNAQNSEIAAGCVNHGKPKFCSFQGCCSLSIAGDSSWINFPIGGVSYLCECKKVMRETAIPMVLVAQVPFVFSASIILLDNALLIYYYYFILFYND
eukprot:Gb_36914 [translate_table: standard]